MVPNRPAKFGSISFVIFFSIDFHSVPQFFSKATSINKLSVPFVAMGPGETVLTVMPVPASCLAKLIVILILAALVAPYAGKSGEGLTPATLAIWIIRPHPNSFICGRNA